MLTIPAIRSESVSSSVVPAGNALALRVTGPVKCSSWALLNPALAIFARTELLPTFTWIWIRFWSRQLPKFALRSILGAVRVLSRRW
jgi:hypothetical protein